MQRAPDAQWGICADPGISVKIELCNNENQFNANQLLCMSWALWPARAIVWSVCEEREAQVMSARRATLDIGWMDGSYA